ncbi:MAG TPA: TerC family protein [Gaiellaceae bacterium]|nr:TerC family protein [Gaiellaceae bacterium]
MLDVPFVAWVLTVLAVVCLLGLDFALAARRPHVVQFREAVAWSVFYIGVALAFGVGFGFATGWEWGAEYFAGYAVEKSLSVDNLFVFVIIMSTFAVPAEQQHRVLTFGIAIALALRAVFIALGAALLSLFSFMFVLFGALLVFTGVQLYRHRDQDPTLDDNVVVVLARRHLPFTDRYDGGRLTTRENGRRLLTPLALVLVAIGTTDVVFALDSIPAIFGITQEAYIVFAANAFALLGLRALYFLVSGLLDRLVYLAAGLSVILVFIGIKLVLHYLHKHWESIPEVSAAQSLALIGAVLTLVTIASIVKARRDPTARAHAGSLRRHDANGQPQSPPPGAR